MHDIVKLNVRVAEGSLFDSAVALIEFARFVEGMSSDPICECISNLEISAEMDGGSRAVTMGIAQKESIDLEQARSTLDGYVRKLYAGRETKWLKAMAAESKP